MPSFDATGQVIILDQNEELLSVSGTTVIGNTNSGFLFYGVKPNLTASVVSLATDGRMLTSGTTVLSSTVGSFGTSTNPFFITGTISSVSSLSGAVDQGLSGSTSWKVELRSGTVQVGTENYPLTTLVPLYGRTNFGQQRVTLPYTLTDIVNKYGFDGIEYSSSTVGGGVVTGVLSQSAIRMSVGATNGDSARIRTNTYYRYQAGKEQIVKITCYHQNTGNANQIKRWGYFDDSNGLYFALSGTNFGIYKRSSAMGTTVDTFITQSSWNGDPLNGTGPSGITLDITKSQIYEIRFDWLGVGSNDFYINQKKVHTIQNANSIAGPYMGTATLPISLELQNNGASTANAFNFICCSIEAEGGSSPPEYSFAAYNSADVSVTTTERPVLAIRPALTFKGVENRVLTLPFRFGISTEGARIGYRLIINPTTLTGGSWVAANTLNSSVEYNSTATAFTGGDTLYRGFLANSNDQITFDLENFFDYFARKLRIDAFGTSQDVLLITAINEAAGTTLVRSSLTWKEIR